ncbi:MAG: hypothetical protein L6W00_04100 [Lentisphaeria bacterium]|nr:MAG: hypothetical protein L6W00_04100 [Lentisphaeria bacterium]
MKKFPFFRWGKSPTRQPAPGSPNIATSPKSRRSAKRRCCITCRDTKR